MNIFSQESKLIQILNLISDLIVLNILALVCSMPVITCGASISALYHVTLKMVKNEEGKIGISFLKAFKENFKQSTLIWLIGIGINVFLYVDIRILSGWNAVFSLGYTITLLIFTVLVGMCTIFSLVVQARFENTLKSTIRNGISICLLNIVRAVSIFIIILAPVLVCILFPGAFLFMILLGMSGPAYLNSIFFRKLFEKYEQKEELSKKV